MMLMHELAPLTAPLPAVETETISISLGVGSARSSSIVLPRGHDLVKHLERLIPASTPPQQHPLLWAPPPKRQEDAATRFDAVRALSLLPLQLPQPQAPFSPMHEYNCATTRDLMSSASNRPQSPLYHSDTSSTGSVCIHPYQPHANEPRVACKRRRQHVVSSSTSKRCQVKECDKISVSRGLCRGHGGGRRCQHADCTKGAQSRSDFCWAHGGGQRCEVKCCMRSRKSKRFCVAHLNWETPAVTLPAPIRPLLEAVVPGRMDYFRPVQLTTVSPVNAIASTGSPRLPSLFQALRNTQSSMCMSMQG